MKNDQMLLLDPTYLSDVEKSVIGALCLFSGPAYDFTICNRLSTSLPEDIVNTTLQELVARKLVTVVTDTNNNPMYWVTSAVLRHAQHPELNLV